VPNLEINGLVIRVANLTPDVHGSVSNAELPILGLALSASNGFPAHLVNSLSVMPLGRLELT